MPSFIRLIRRVLSFAVFTLILNASAFSAELYDIIQLDPVSPNFGNFSVATAINNEGVVIGNGTAQYTTDLVHIWRPNQLPTPHYFSGYNRTTAEGINDLGQYVGFGPAGDGIHGFLMSTDLGFGKTYDINNKGQVVGRTYDSTYIYLNGVFYYLPTSDWGSEAVAINDSGVAVGYWYTDCTSDCPSEACIFRNDSAILIGTLGGDAAGATDINNQGQIVGWSCLGNDCLQLRGFLWRNGVMTQIPTLGGNSSLAYAINEFGVVVGMSRTADNSEQPFIYDTINGIRNLMDLIPLGSGWTELSSATDINEHGEIVGVGKINNLTRGFLLTPAVNRFVELQDVNFSPIPYTRVKISKVADDPPLYTETFLLFETTDDQGRIKVPRSLRTPGQKVKFEILAHEQPAVKGSPWFKNLYSVRLDNMAFDSLGLPSFDTTTLDEVQTISMKHTSIAINLIVSVQWDAELSYLTSLENGLRMASNYLYDVTNGQAYLDTVRIYDHAENWNSTDVQIFSSNQEWPRAYAADRTNGFGTFSADGAKTLMLPRLFYINEMRANRELDWTIYPYNWSVPITTFDFDGAGPKPSYSVSFCPSRTLVHELGHYFFGFYDEYMDQNGNNVWPNFNYGMMDDQLIPGDIQSSELSTFWQYRTADKQVNKQWLLRGACWNWFEIDIGEVHDGIRCPIVRPDEIGAANNVVTGPNDVVLAPDYDIGSKLVFPVAPTSPYYGKTKVARVQTFFGFPVAGAEVQLEREYYYSGNSGVTIIKQGKTNADGRIRIVGFQGSDEITSQGGYVSSSGAATATVTARPLAFSDSLWYYFATNDMPPDTADGFVLESRLVDGYFPTILQIKHSDSVSTEFRMDVLGQWTDPFLYFYNSSGIETGMPLLFDSVAYTAHAGSIESSGAFYLKMYNSGSYLTVQGAFSREKAIGGASAQFLSSNGDATLSLDSAATSSGLEFVSMLSTPYLVIRTGLSENNLRVSETYSMSTAPEGLFVGAAHLKIRYAPDGLTESEEQSVRIFKWDEQLRTWILLGGTANVEDDAVIDFVVEAGTYAAFTTALTTGTNDEGGDNLPYRFNMSQNYPNPFNPTTTIEYSVPSRTDVTIEILNVLGQKVRTLVHETKSAGSHKIEWNGADDAGRRVSTGVYWYRFSAGEIIQTKKMILLK